MMILGKILAEETRETSGKILARDDCDVSRPGFPGNKFPEKTVVLISPRITVS